MKIYVDLFLVISHNSSHDIRDLVHSFIFLHIYDFCSFARLQEWFPLMSGPEWLASDVAFRCRSTKPDV